MFLNYRKSTEHRNNYHNSYPNDLTRNLHSNFGSGNLSKDIHNVSN